MKEKDYFSRYALNSGMNFNGERLFLSPYLEFLWKDALIKAA
ncbi:hypothetical protein [Methanosarcina sp.]|nr:hypothetical protein [Methanosarcina sp.]MDY9924932.1 hypothetical protein [Methanosarcina sp.]